MTHSFEFIISQICNHSMLTIPALSDKFAVFTDASSCGEGGVLCVCRDDVWVPCAYYSRQLLPREQRYAATELEALAMLTAIEHFSSAAGIAVVGLAVMSPIVVFPLLLELQWKCQLCLENL